MNDTPTPRSDKAKIAFTSLFANDDAYWIPYVVGKNLESELTAAREELAEWSILKGWGGTPEIINNFIKGQQTRIYYEQNLEENLTLAQEEIAQLKSQLTKDQGAVTISRNGYVQELEEQRDRLAEALESIIGEAAFEGIPESKQQFIYEALQSLTTNEL